MTLSCQPIFMISSFMTHWPFTGAAAQIGQYALINWDYKATRPKRQLIQVKVKATTGLLRLLTTFNTRLGEV